MASQLRNNLSQIFGGGSGDIADAWNSTAAAGDDTPIPAGTYTCHVVELGLKKSKTNQTPGCAITFEVLDGDHEGRRVWYDLWLTPAALPRTKRDLAKIGITEFDQLEQPIPRGIRCSVVVVVRKNDEGVERNEVRRFECLGVDAPEPNPFPPDDVAASDESDPGVPV